VVNHPLQNAEVFSNVRSANLNFFFNKSAFLKSHHLRISFKTCVLTNVCLDNVGPNSYIFTFCTQKARYLDENVGPNPLIKTSTLSCKGWTK
jgi:hypothetical protein